VNFLPGFLGAAIALVALSALVTLVFFPVAIGSTVRMVSDEVQTGQTDLGASIRFTVSKLVWIWVVSLITGIVVFLGVIALIVPGIILAIMFSLALPAILIEDHGVLDSLRRSRELVGHRWLKTFALFIVIGVIILIVTSVADAIGGLFGSASTVVSSILSAFYLPLIPIVLTVYYYSNAARIAPPQMNEAPMPQVISEGAFQGGTKFCISCGTQLPSAATFCSKCGTRQST
jgi:hypothetical protein